MDLEAGNRQPEAGSLNRHGRSPLPQSQVSQFRRSRHDAAGTLGAEAISLFGAASRSWILGGARNFME